MNVVMTGNGEYVEIQASAEGRPFAGSEMQELLRLVTSVSAYWLRSSAACSLPSFCRVADKFGGNL